MPEHVYPVIDAPAFDARVREMLGRRAAVGLAAGVVRDGRLELFHGHGLADIASGTPITEDTVFRIASITKTFTAIAVMQLWERGLVDLDAPAAEYVRAYRLVPARARFRPATVRHLLTHTAGVPQVLHPSDWLRPERGEAFEVGRAPTLAAYYRGGLRLVREPGTRFTYGDHGFATLGQLVEDVSGSPLDRYLREHVFDPLGMASTELGRSRRVVRRLATGYTIGSMGPEPVPDRDGVTAAAGAIYSTPRDMARYLAALLGGGSGERVAVLRPDTVAIMFEPHFQTDPRVAGMGLGFFRADVRGHLAIWHEGALPGFNSQVFLSPADRTAVMAFTNGATGALLWMITEVADLLGDTLGWADEAIRADVPQRPEMWGGLRGFYRLSAQWTDVQSRSMGGLGVEVFVRRGRLMLRILSPVPALYRGFELHPDVDRDPCVFRIDLARYGMGTPRVVFGGEREGRMTRIHVDVIPLWLERRPAMLNPRPWAIATAAALGAAAIAGAARHRRRRGT